MRSPTAFKKDQKTMGRELETFQAVKLKDASVHYRFDVDRPTSLKEFVIRTIKKDIERQTVRALDGVSMEVQKGEVFGVIGRNGAGKSTLLKLISRIIRPTHGRVLVWDRVTSLLSVGAGFSHELTGRENIFLYSALLGRSQERTLDIFEGIVDFAELEEFIDAPLRTYSTGMVARLGFAVAMVETPEILLVDEVLAVGDEQFQKKCQDRFREIQASGATIIIVSHSMAAIEDLCERALWLAEGKAVRIDLAPDVVAAYRSSQVAPEYVEGMNR